MAEESAPELATIPVGAHKGSIDYLKTLAISRLTLNNIDNFQSSWVTQGKKIGQLTLFYGANDLGSTMMEENVVSAAGISYRLSMSDMDELIRSAGFTPAQRDNYYKILRAA
jgi:cyclic dehypoxanthinyl futalosine synthase